MKKNYKTSQQPEKPVSTELEWYLGEQCCADENK